MTAGCGRCGGLGLLGGPDGGQAWSWMPCPACPAADPDEAAWFAEQAALAAARKAETEHDPYDCDCTDCAVTRMEARRG